MGKYAVTFLTAILLLGADVPKRAPRTQEKTVYEKLQEAFPGGRVENAPIKFDLHSKRLLIAADSLQIEADGKVRLEGCVIARFQPPKGSGKPLQPTTIRCQFARITLDRPAKNFTDWASRKIVSIELSGGFRLALEE